MKGKFLKFRKKGMLEVISLFLMTLIVGYFGISKKMIFKNKEEKIYTSNNETELTLPVYDYSINEDYNHLHQDTYYNSNSNKYGYYDNYTNYDFYDNYNDYQDYYNYDNYNYVPYQNYNYNDKEAPAIEYTSKKTIYLNEYYNIMEGIQAHHSKFGDLTHLIEIVYNNVDNTRIGNYLVIYKACNYPGSSYCRTVERNYIVKNKEEYYNKAASWSNSQKVSCYVGDTSCLTSRITPPTATDPYSKRQLRVFLDSGDVNIYAPGIYILKFKTFTEYNMESTKTVSVTILEKDYYSDNSNTNYSNSKYVTNHYSSYYDDGIYSGYLQKDTANNNFKYISNYEWENKVTYIYRCDIAGGYGTDGWSLFQTVTSDNHPTYYYNSREFQGTLYKDSFYCKYGCSERLVTELGICNNVGEKKQIYRTFVGIYSGTVYANQNVNTYSGYVYLK